MGDRKWEGDGSSFRDVVPAVAANAGLAAAVLVGGAEPVPLATALMVVLGVASTGILVIQVRRVRALGRMRAGFVARVSHDLRTPLAHIRLYSDLLEGGSARTEEERRRWAQVVGRESERLAYLVEHLLAFSFSPGSDRTEAPVLERFRARPAVSEVAHSFQPLARSRRARVQVCVPDHLEVQASRSHLRLSLFALLDNAVKYGPTGQTISIGAAPAGDGQVHLWVEDAGSGIPEEDRESVWAPFVRLDRAVEAASGGSGVGLTVVRQLTESQGGTTWIADGPGGAGVRVGLTLSGGLAANGCDSHSG